MTGLAPSVGPNRVSFHFNFTGPSVAIETACSSALVAIHRAAEAIHSGDCDAAIAGGVNALLSPDTFEGFARAGMLAADGRCKTFSADADGYGRGEGIGLVFLKRQLRMPSGMETASSRCCAQALKITVGTPAR